MWCFTKKYTCIAESLLVKLLIYAIWHILFIHEQYFLKRRTMPFSTVYMCRKSCDEIYLNENFSIHLCKFGKLLCFLFPENPTNFASQFYNSIVFFFLSIFRRDLFCTVLVLFLMCIFTFVYRPPPPFPTFCSPVNENAPICGR